MTEQAPVLEVRNLNVNFILEKKRINAVKDVSFRAYSGQTLGIVGESGCGKSVTATSILRLLPERTSQIESGEVLLDGVDILKFSLKELRQIRGNEISMIFQDPMTSLNPVQKIGKQLKEIIDAHQKVSSKQAYQMCVDMMRRVGIPEPELRMKKYPHELSGGMKQRVIIAMALLSSPKVLIADEPTTALDVTIQAQILDLINELQREYNTAVILITHDMGVVAETADQVAVMYAGEVVEYDTVEGIFNNPQHPYTRGLLQAIPRFDTQIETLTTIPGVVPSLTQMPQGCRFSNRCEFCTEQCRASEVPLRQVLDSKWVRCRLAHSLKAGDADE